MQIKKYKNIDQTVLNLHGMKDRRSEKKSYISPNITAIGKITENTMGTKTIFGGDGTGEYHS